MSTHLTQIRLNLADRQVQADLADHTSLHRTVMSLLPDELGEHPRAAARCLHRVEDGRSGTVILLQSDPAPNLDALPDGYALDARTTSLDTLLGTLRTGTPVRYRILANPAKRVGGRQDPMRGKVVGLHGTAAEDWWHRRAHAAGLTVESVTAAPKPRHRATRRTGGPARHDAVQFDGTATIHDPDAAVAAVTTGIGKGKAHGLGLLSLAPVLA